MPLTGVNVAGSIRSLPVNSGRGAETSPYAPNVIGAPAVPLSGADRASRHWLPRSNRIVSPGWNVEASTLATVCHGWAADVPGFWSLPALLT